MRVKLHLSFFLFSFPSVFHLFSSVFHLFSSVHLISFSFFFFLFCLSVRVKLHLLFLLLFPSFLPFFLVSWVVIEGSVPATERHRRAGHTNGTRRTSATEERLRSESRPETQTWTREDLLTSLSASWLLWMKGNWRWLWLLVVVGTISLRFRWMRVWN